MEFILHVHQDQLFQYSWSDSELCVGRTSSGPVIIIHASLLTLSDSLPTAFQLLETVKSSYKYLVSFSVFHHALAYTQCSLSLHVLEVCDYKYNLLWVFRMRGCWELFSEITLQKKKSSQCSTKPSTALGKVIAQGIGEWDTFFKLPPVNTPTWPLHIWVGIWISWTYWNNFIIETGILALNSQTILLPY